MKFIHTEAGKTNRPTRHTRPTLSVFLKYEHRKMLCKVKMLKVTKGTKKTKKNKKGFVIIIIIT